MNEQNIFIVRCGEVALKGMNKPYFEKMLVNRIKKLLKKFDNVEAYRHEGLIFVRADKKHDPEMIIGEISKVFGVASISPALECESELNSIGDAAVALMMDLIEKKGIKTFKVDAKRADKIPTAFCLLISAKTNPMYLNRKYRDLEDFLWEPTVRAWYCFQVA